MKQAPYIFFLLLCFLHQNAGAQVSAQNSNCAVAAPFCTGNVMSFPAATQQPPAQAGPNYGCLFSQPNPTWYYMQIASAGPVTIAMSAAQDIDFICWGPFPSLATACNSLTGNNIQSCSYSPSNTETCTIANAQAGMFYMVLITNFAGVNQQITFAQTNSATPGAGVTNCGIVCSVTLTNSGMLCSGQSATLTALTNTSINSFTLSAPGSVLNTGTLANVSNTITQVVNSLTSSATYTLRASNANGTCQATSNVTVIPFPTFSLTPNSATICQGGSVTAAVTFSPGTNVSLFSYSWAPAPGFGLMNLSGPSTTIAPPPISTSQSVIIYTVTVSRTALNCPLWQGFALTVNNPATPLLQLPGPLCNTSTPVMLNAVPGGGTWSANPGVSGPGSFSPALAPIGTSSLSYAVSIGSCVVNTSGTVSVSQFITPALSSNPGTLCVQDQALNLMGLVQNTTNGSWSGPSVFNGSFVPTGLPTGTYQLTYSTQSTPIQSVCPSFTNLAVSVFNPPVPVISPITAKCTNAPPVQLSANPPGGVWLGTGVSVSGLQNPALNLIGANTLTYTAGQGTCVASSTASFHVSQFNTASLTALIPQLCVNQSPFNLMNIVQNTVSGVWSGVSVTGGFFNPAGLPTGAYTLTYNTLSSPNPSLCPDTRTAVASVLNPPTPSITPVGPLCSKSPALQMTVSPGGGQWASTNYLSTGGVFTPSNCAPGNNSVQYIIGTPTCQASNVIQVSVEAFVPASIIGSIPDQCNTSSAVNLLPFTANNAGAWSGPGVNGQSFNPAIGAGQYVLSYNTASFPSALCPDQATVAVRVFSLAPPVISNAGPFCNTDAPVQLQVSPAGGLFGSPVNGLVSLGGLFTPGFGNMGDNVVSYSISSGPCVAFAQTLVNVNRFVPATFAGYPGPYCRDNVPVNLNAFVTNPGGLWAGPGMAGSMFSPAQANTGLNVITYSTFSTPNPTLCPDTYSISIQVNQTPSVSIRVFPEHGCAPVEVLVNMSEYNTGKGYWNFGDGSPIQQGLNSSHVYLQPGQYTVSVVYTDDIGCRAQAQMKGEIRVEATPVADFSAPERVYISNPEVDLINQSQVLEENTYLWQLEGMPDKRELHARYRFEKAGIYQVTLTATGTGQDKCSHSVMRSIEVRNDYLVYIPDAFTPNYDGLNDVFMPVFSPYGLDEKTYALEVFDRWGQQLFSSTSPQNGWNGTVQNKGQEPLKADVYIYRIKYKDLDGNVYNHTGHVSLVK